MKKSKCKGPEVEWTWRAQGIAEGLSDREKQEMMPEGYPTDLWFSGKWKTFIGLSAEKGHDLTLTPERSSCLLSGREYKSGSTETW